MATIEIESEKSVRRRGSGGWPLLGRSLFFQLRQVGSAARRQSRSWPGAACLAWCIGGALFPVTVARPESRVVVISPHNEAIRYEFARGFGLWYRKEFKEEAVVEWRDLGGTSDALHFVESEFANKPQGIGIDCFFGGGLEPYLLLKDKGLLQPYEPPAEILSGIPSSFGGVEVYDTGHAWFGAALSSFGILQNLNVQRRVGLPVVNRWDQLAEPRLSSWVGAGDPRNSGTMNNMFEAFLQAYGWDHGWRLLTEIAGNVRRFDRFSSTTAKAVTLGEVAYAFAIDFYGFTQIAVAGRTNMIFALPQDFTAISADGIAILRGAPDPLPSRRFIDFVLSEPGQKLWFLPRGHPEGPQRYSIERMAVRPDLYRRYRDVSNIAYSPFDLQQRFHYDAVLARKRREVVAALAGATLVDTHAELQAAWRSVVQRGMRPAEIARLGSTVLSARDALALATGPWSDATVRNQKKIEWQVWAQKKYRGLQ